MVKKRIQTNKPTIVAILYGLFPYFLPVVFFIVSLFTVGDYGFNWDSPAHFARGQAFLRYVLTGKTNYSGLPLFCQNQDGLNKRIDYLTGEVCDKTRKNRVSEYESTILDFNWAKKITYGHPPFSDIMLAASNQIFFKWLGVYEDIHAYHLFPVFMTFVLLLVVSLWANMTYGKFASVISVLSLGLFPFLFGEQHFNIKDPPIAAFFALGIFFFWLGIIRKKAKFIFLSAVFGGMSFATKINYIFAPFILIPWIFTYIASSIIPIIHKKSGSLRKKILNTSLHLFPKRVTLVIIFSPFIIASIFFLSWPAMWFDTLNGLNQFLTYYKDIGVKVCPYMKLSPQWFFSCSDLLTVKYFFYSIPVPTLALFCIGIAAGIKRWKDNGSVTVLWLSFFFLTILRVTLSVSSIYGGLRQILEFSAPMALLAGLGAVTLRNMLVQIISRIVQINKKTITFCVSLVIILAYLPITLTIIKLHPNENLYFNWFIGGISGAARQDFPGYGNSYGNAFNQGVKWLNSNGVKDGRLALVFGLAQNISRASLRNDILYDNSFRSGYNMNGEYQLVQLLQGDPQVSKFSFQYLNRFFTPVYVDSVEGVPILKIWKNESKYLKKGVSFEEKEEKTGVTQKKEEGFFIRLPEKRVLKRLEFFYPPECEIPVKSATVSVGENIDNLHLLFLSPQNFTQNEIRGYRGDSVFLFAGDEAKMILIQLPDAHSCDINSLTYKLFIFK